MVKIPSNNSLAKQGGADSAPIIRQRYTHISTGHYNTILLEQDGSVYGFVSNMEVGWDWGLMI